MTTLLGQTMAAAVADTSSVGDDGKKLQSLPDGAMMRHAPVITDDRGELQEIFSESWGFHEPKLSHLYMTTLWPNVVKGWSLHERQCDRYFVPHGVVQVVMFDPRPESSTFGEVFSVTLGGGNRQLLLVPQYV